MAFELNEIQLEKQINKDDISLYIIDRFTNNKRMITNQEYKNAYTSVDGTSRKEQYSAKRENRDYFNSFILRIGSRGDDLRKSKDTLEIIELIYEKKDIFEKEINAISQMTNQIKLIQNIK
jgi:hypothetical protein